MKHHIFNYVAFTPNDRQKVLKWLANQKYLTLITSSIPLLQMYRAAKARLVGLGVEVRSISGALVGSVTLSWLEILRADIALLGASKLAPDGLSTTELNETAVKQAFRAQAEKSFLLSASGKWKHPATFRFASWNDIDPFYTSAGFLSNEVKAIRRQGVEVIFAS